MLKRTALLLFAGLGIWALPVFAECPPGDLTGDCAVDLNDFALVAKWWLLECDPSNNWCGGTDLLRSGSLTMENLAAVAISWRHSLGGEMVPIAGGTFQMGDSFNEGAAGERPVHEVTLSPFAIGRHEITNGRYCQFLNFALSQGSITVIDGIVYKAGADADYPYCDTSTSSSYSRIVFAEDAFGFLAKGGRDMDDDPVIRVSWFGAAAFCNWLSEQEDREPCYDLSDWSCDFGRDGYHLPTEAQWEYAARGGLSGKRFPWGDTIAHDNANYFSAVVYHYDVSSTAGYHPVWNDGVRPYTSPAASFAANGYGLHDMAGNVLEWCNDWHGGYSAASQTDPAGPATGSYRVLRGGGWDQIASLCRGTHRHIGAPANRNNNYGFRVVRTQR